jgi:hypothetical protein
LIVMTATPPSTSVSTASAISASLGLERIALLPDHRVSPA